MSFKPWSSRIYWMCVRDWVAGWSKLRTGIFWTKIGRAVGLPLKHTSTHMHLLKKLWLYVFCILIFCIRSLSKYFLNLFSKRFESTYARNQIPRAKQDFPAVECPGFLATYSHLVEVWGRWNLCFESPRVSGKSGCALLVSLWSPDLMLSSSRDLSLNSWFPKFPWR